MLIIYTHPETHTHTQTLTHKETNIDESNISLNAISQINSFTWKANLSKGISRYRTKPNKYDYANVDWKKVGPISIFIII